MQQTSGTTSSLRGVCFVDALHGWAVGDGVILSTSIGGVAWASQATPLSARANAVTFTDAMTGWIVGASGMVLHTIDGGLTWQAQDSKTTAELNCVEFVDPQNGWSAGMTDEGGVLLRTRDGGSTWTKQTLNGSDTYWTGLSALNASHVWAAATEMLWETQDGGEHWTGGYSDEDLKAVAYPSDSDAWAVGNLGTILHTSDGGVTWHEQASSVGDSLLGVAAANTSELWAVGAAGTVLHTNNGGSVWTTQTPGTTDDLMGVTASGPAAVWVVGGGGTIVHSADGGAHWAAQVSGTASFLTSACFVTPEEGWAVGADGTIIHTSDGGTHWGLQDSGTAAYLRSVAFADALNGWAAGSGGTILHTTNGGASWIAQDGGTTADIVSVVALGVSRAWACGRVGILRTETSGQVWGRQSTGFDDAWISAGAYRFGGRAIAVGDLGTVLGTKTDWGPGRLSYTAGSGGSIEGSASQLLKLGGSGTAVTASADLGCYFVSWSDGVPSATRSDVGCGDLAFTAEFGYYTHVLEYTAQTGGMLIGALRQVVNYSGGSEVRAVAGEGYHFVRWSDGVTSPTRADTKILADISVAAQFVTNASDPHTIRYLAGPSGSIAGQAQQTLAWGEDATSVTATPAPGYHFVVWSDGATSAARTDRAVTKDATLTATFSWTLLPTRVTIATSRSSVPRRHAMTLSGSVSSNLQRGVHIEVWAKRPGKGWARLSTRLSSSQHRWTYTYAPSTRGTWYFQARFKGTSKYGSSNSLVKKVTVR